MSDIVLYAQDISPPCRTVFMVAKEIGLNLKIHEIRLEKLEHLTDEFLQINSLHTIPVLNENGFVLTDSHAIVCYLIDKYAKDDSLYPKDLQKRALVNQYLMLEAATIFPPAKSLIRPILFGEETSISEGKMDACRETYWHLNELLEGKKWLVGDSYTVADISCVTVVTSGSILMNMDLYPNVKAWIKRCEQEMPSYDECNVPGLKKLFTFLSVALPTS